MKNHTIRELAPAEIPLLRDFLYEAIFQRDTDNLLPREVIARPELRVFIDDYGKPDDNCLVAVCDGKLVGAVWTRILCGAVKGFGNVDDKTPEFAISLYKEYRGRGIGTELMKRMLLLLKAKGYAQASLTVQKDNYAVNLYRKVGFEIIAELEEEYLMLCRLDGKESRMNKLCYQSPVGPLTLMEEKGALTGIWFGQPEAAKDACETESELLCMVRTQLAEYFAGTRTAFDLPLAPAGTAFQKKVWDAMAAIPYGQTATYGQLAAQVGSPRASRAVGGACHNNPIAIILPCHRVVGSTGSLTGYAGGLDIKKWLLALEQSAVQ